MPMLRTGPESKFNGDPKRGHMSNDKKPKKAKPPVVHGAHGRGSDLSGRLAAPLAPAALTPAKKKK